MLEVDRCYSKVCRARSRSGMMGQVGIFQMTVRETFVKKVTLK